MQDHLLNAIETLYDCVGDKYDTPRALETCSKIADDSGVFLPKFGANQKSFQRFDSFNMPEECVRMASSLFDDPAENLILRLYPVLPQGVPTLGRVFMSDDDYQNSRMYQLASKPWGLHGECVCVVAREKAYGRAIGFVRHKQQPDTGPELLSMLAVLGRHLQRAMSFQTRINRLEELVIQSINVLDLIQFGLLLYSTDRELLYANSAASRIFEAEDGIRLKNGDITVSHRETETKLNDLLDTVFQPEASLAQLSGGIITIPRPSHGRPYSLIVVPMVANKVKSGKASIAIFLFDPDARKTTAIDLFVASYSLTRSEAHLAHALASGDTLEAIAEKRGVSRNTIKSQLHSIFAKTNTSRQSELVSLLLQSVAGIHIQG